MSSDEGEDESFQAVRRIVEGGLNRKQARRAWGCLFPGEPLPEIDGRVDEFLHDMRALGNASSISDMVAQMQKWCYRNPDSVASSEGDDVLPSTSRLAIADSEQENAVLNVFPAIIIAQDMATENEASRAFSTSSLSGPFIGSSHLNAESSSSRPGKRAHEDGPDGAPTDRPSARIKTGPSPRQPVISWSTAEVKIKQLLEDFTDHIFQVGMFSANAKGFVPEEHLWQPPAHWKDEDPDVEAHLRELSIPAIPHTLRTYREPDMLLHALGGEEHDGTMNSDFRDKLRYLLSVGHALLNQASGSGKTRMLFAVLARAWGFYFTCLWKQGSDPYGSQDIVEAFRMIESSDQLRPDGLKFTSSVQDWSTGADSQAGVEETWLRNRTIATDAFRAVLLARLLVYTQFRRIATAKALPESEARIAWCMLQICPHFSGVQDVFCGILERLKGVSSAEITKQTDAVLSHLAQTEQTPKYLVFDEAQVAAEMWKSAFGPTPGEITTASTFLEKCRPVLKPLADAMHTLLPIKVLISGTKLRTQSVKNALSSTLMKRDGYHMFSDFGESRRNNILPTIRAYIPNIYEKLRDQGELVHSILKWLQGRHRFLARFIHGVLMAGSSPAKLQNVLSNIIIKSTGFPSIDPLYENLPYMDMARILPNILRNRADYSQKTYRSLETAVMHFLLESEYANASPETLELVEHGLGRFQTVEQISGYSDDKIVINENLVLASLMGWATRTGDDGFNPLVEYINTAFQESDTGSTGKALELATQLLGYEFFGDDGRILSDVFTFLSEPPAWARARARLIGTFKGSSMSGKTVLQEKAKTVTLGLKSADSVTSLEWFLKRRATNTDDVPLDTVSLEEDHSEVDIPPKNYVPLPRVHPPILQPDRNWGPDVIFGVLLDPTGIEGTGLTEPTELLICIQCKNKKEAHSLTDSHRRAGGQVGRL
ncbi:hypothetical protein EXIGLDRAFT_748117 [Exidia glandulosa HHB12029]|uniref:Uncharacterized protein n=1 Tax=Exidia glandulosa HHB12029 TaxID=1314781 RepID=A0A165JZP6_EXIGL|nr:hypothetical protein EXIGLDRAFT_748117 [Exidia glandulosa HHB12029]